MKQLTSTFLLLIALCSFSQTSDNQFSMELSEVVGELESRYGIAIRDPENLVEGKTLTYALWRFKPDLEKTLQNIFTAVDLTIQKEGEKKYKVKKFQYHRLSLEEGKAKLAWMESQYSDKEEWESRRAELKTCIREALGIDKFPPAPDKDPLLANKRKMKGYSVENIALEVLPGLYATGSVYKPSKIKGKAPIVLCPNGHFGDGRYRPDQQKRCAALAKMGAIAISYDLFAWGESLLQFKPEDHHRSLAMQVQALNSIRLLDYLTTLPDVDPERIAITGGSGGGSHTMLLSAIDERIQVSVPVVMLSCIHYGGCPCESGMPIHLCGQGTNNVEMAAMFAPKPMLIVSDGGDWTANVPKVEYPFIQRTYSFFGKTDFVNNTHFEEEGHDYGTSKRLAMYPFIARHLGLELNAIKNKKGEIDESFVTIEEQKDMLVFGENGELLPEGAIKSINELENWSIMNKKEDKNNSRRRFLISAGTLAGAAAILPTKVLATGSGDKKKKKNKKEPRYKIAVCDWMILKRQKKGAFQRTHEIGADGLELDMGGLGNRPTWDNKILNPVERRMLKDEIAKYNLELSSIAMSGFYAQSFPERENVDVLVKDTINSMDLMGVKTAFLPLGVKGDLVQHPEVRPAVVERLKMAAEMAEASNVVIGIETALDAAGELELLQEVGSPAIKSYFNFANALQNGRDLIQEIKTLGKENICQIHCTDEDGVWLENNTRLNMPEVKKTLDEIGWSGWLVIERSRDANNPKDVIGNFSANTKYLKSIFQ